MKQEHLGKFQAYFENNFCVSENFIPRMSDVFIVDQ